MNSGGVKKQADHVEQHCVGSSLRQLNRVISSLFNAELAAVGLTGSQFNIMTALAKMQTASPAKVAKVLHLEKSSLSRNVERMRRNGWLQSGGSPRAVQLSLTAAGENVYASAFPCWERAQKASRKLIGSEAAGHLRTVLQSMRPD